MLILCAKDIDFLFNVLNVNKCRLVIISRVSLWYIYEYFYSLFEVGFIIVNRVCIVPAFPVRSYTRKCGVNWSQRNSNREK